MTLLTERYAPQIAGVLSCFDRIVITGTLVGVCFAEGMAAYLRQHGIRLFDYPRFAEPLREEIRQNAERIAQESGLEIEFIRSVGAFRKEDRIRAILQQRGDQPGLVHIFSAMEPCAAFTPWHDKATGRTTLRYKDGKCLHYYFYFIDPEFGLCYLRVPTWAPFRLQFYCNGHNWLAGQLGQAGIAFAQLDNTFSSIADFSRAQLLADAFPIDRLHHALDGFAARYCPVAGYFGSAYHWSLMQVEYATDIVFHRQADLRPLYETLVRTAIHAVRADNVATFLGRKLTGNYRDELGNDFHTRIEGARLKHHMGPVSIKLYDKQGLVLRIETTVNDVSFFRHHRTVEHRDRTCEAKLAPMQKTIYSLGPLRELLLAANRRYLAFLSDLTDPSAGVRQVERLGEPVREQERSYRGFNLFSSEDLALFIALARGEWQISGFRNSSLRRLLPDRSGPQVSRLLKRLHLRGLIKKIGHTYKYYLTDAGRRVVLTALKLRELVVIPSLAGLLPANA
jgi:hypothetical protein